jgi:hypothetical protein
VRWCEDDLKEVIVDEDIIVEVEAIERVKPV